MICSYWLPSGSKIQYSTFFIGLLPIIQMYLTLIGSVSDYGGKILNQKCMLGLHLTLT